MVKKFRCIKGFSIGEVDGDGCSTGNNFIIEDGSIWEQINKEDSRNLTDNEYCLEESQTGEYMEISEKYIKENFEEIKVN